MPALERIEGMGKQIKVGGIYRFNGVRVVVDSHCSGTRWCCRRGDTGEMLTRPVQAADLKPVR